MGRNAKSIALHLAQGNPNRLTKAEIEARKKSEIKLGKAALDKVKPPPIIKNDVVAYGHWKQLLKEYKEAAANGIELLTSSDIGMLVLYCKTYADYERLLKSYQSIDKIAYDNEDLDNYIENSDEFDYKVKQQLRAMVAVDGMLRIETAINKKMDMLIKMQDRLFLNPLAKVKNIPKRKEAPKEDPLKAKGFGNV